MFLKHVFLKDILYKNNANYSWYNGFYINNLKKNKFSFKLQFFPFTKGSTILINKNISGESNFNESDSKLKHPHNIVNDNFNFLINFNLSLMIALELYKSMSILFLFNFLKSN
jgi:hypothetical protein